MCTLKLKATAYLYPSAVNAPPVTVNNETSFCFIFYNSGASVDVGVGVSLPTNAPKKGGCCQIPLRSTDLYEICYNYSLRFVEQGK